MSMSIDSFPSRAKGFFHDTPLVSVSASDSSSSSSSKFHLKLDNMQPSGSFKDRGISHMIYKTAQQNKKLSLLISSSGGNAGNAVAHAGHRLGIPVKVFVPSTTKKMMIDKLQAKGAEVIVAGENWNAADAKAREAVQEAGGEKNCLYCPPFDHPLIWEGNASLMHEIAAKVNEIGQVDAVVVSVGGGGLLCGIQAGIESLGWIDKTTIVAIETDGAASFAAAKARGEVVKLDKIDSVATSLGALAVSTQTLKSPVNVESVVVSDSEAVESCLKYADASRSLVEPACGAALSAIYSPRVKEIISSKYKNVVCVVCGGSAVNIGLMNQWKQDFSL